MATTNSITTTYAGEFAGEYISAALLSGKTLNEGAITVKPNVKFKEVIKQVSLTDAIKDASCDFDPTSTVTLTERILEPKELQVNMQLCKSDYRNDWDALSMGFSAHDNLPPSFSDYIIGHVSAKVAESMENNIWQGDDDGADSDAHQLFEGFQQRITSSALAGVGGSTVTSSNAITFLGKVVDNIPSALYGQDDLTIYTPNNVFQAYVRALAANSGGVDQRGNIWFSNDTPLTFDGVKIQRCPGMSSNRAIVAQASNLYFGTGLLSDHNEVKLIDMADIDGSQNVRLIMRFTAGTQVGVLADAKHFTPAT
jgi:hypothetical protein